MLQIKHWNAQTSIQELDIKKESFLLLKQGLETIERKKKKGLYTMNTKTKGKEKHQTQKGIIKLAIDPKKMVASSRSCSLESSLVCLDAIFDRDTAIPASASVAVADDVDVVMIVLCCLVDPSDSRTQVGTSCSGSTKKANAKTKSLE